MAAKLLFHYLAILCSIPLGCRGELLPRKVCKVHGAQLLTSGNLHDFAEPAGER
jgi:hypothetical protein